MKNLTKFEMLFLSDLSRQESDKHTTSQREFDATESRKGHGKYASQTRNTRSRQVNQTCRTRYRTAHNPPPFSVVGRGGWREVRTRVW